MGTQARARGAALPALLLLLLAVSQHAHHVSAWHWPGKPPAGGGGRRVEGRIKTVVLIVMENRSFDHMLGWLKRVSPEIDGLTGAESNALNASEPDTSPRVFVSDAAEFVDPDPGHSIQATREQVFGGNSSWHTAQDPAPMSGFAQQAASMYGAGFAARVMSAFRPEVVPVHSALALEYAVFDRWFSGFAGSTQPNRMYVWSATSHGVISNALPRLARGFPQRSLFDQLDDDGLGFGVYYQQVPSTLFLRSLRRLKHVGKFHKWAKFFEHAAAGALPPLVVLEPAYFDLKGAPANDDHPSHDVAEGQRMLRQVYAALRRSPQWEESLLLVTYDEHGGFFDHVPTPVRHVPSPDGLVGPAPDNYTFERLGVRVPTIMVSPWINKGTVVHEPEGPTPHSHYEASSIAATLRKLFDLKSGFLTKRDAWAGTFEHLFTLRDSPRTDCPDELPSPPWSLRHAPPNEEAPLTEWQQELVQLASQLSHPDGLLSAKKMEKMKVREGAAFAQEAVRRFLEAGEVARSSGADEEEFVLPQKVQTARRAGRLSSVVSRLFKGSDYEFM
eukprot:jgi/Mesen1/3933/ME000209S02939